MNKARRRAAGAAGAGAFVGFVMLHRLGRTSGSTSAERAARAPGDELVPDPQFVTDHTITIDAPPSAVWPWLVQMGWHRGGWYTARWVDLLLFPANDAAADRLHPEWQDLAVGDHVLDGAPETECYFVVRSVEPEHHLVLHSRSHLPPEFRDRYRASINWSWTFTLREIDDHRTRFHFRTRARVAPRWLAAAYWAALVPADHVMAQQMLHGVKGRAEGHRPDSATHGWRRAAETLGALAIMAISPAIRPFHLRWGASGAEADAEMPGDRLLPNAHFVATRAITIDAPPDQVWPWLVQVGLDRAGFYSYDLLDNLGRPSADQILPQWQHLRVGEMVAPMAKPPTPDTSFSIAEIDPPNTMVWTKPDSTWSWKLTSADGQRTRLVTRLKVRYRLNAGALVTIPLIELGDFAMMRRMLLTLRRLARPFASETAEIPPAAASAPT